jgi:hypothetical protein
VKFAYLGESKDKELRKNKEGKKWERVRIKN